MKYLVGIDAGTTNQKAILFGEDGTTIAQAIRPSPVEHFPDGGAIYRAETVWQNLCQMLQEIAAVAGSEVIQQVAGIAVTGMGEAGVPLDRDGQAQYPFIAWFDPRTIPMLDHWKNGIGLERITEITGLRPQHIFSANKLLWLKAYESERFQKMWKWACMEDYVAFRLCGQLKMDTTIASRTMLMDLSKGCWSKELLDEVGLREDQMPELVTAGTYVGDITEEAAAACGLCAGTPVFAGGHDHICGALACGILDESSVLDSSGTAEEVLLTTPDLDYVRPLGTEGFNIGRYAKEGYYYMASGIPASGATMDWARRTFGQQEGQVPGARGLLFLPHLRGSSSPLRDSRSKGAFLGIRAEHTMADFTQAVCEGLCYEFRLSADRLLGGRAPQRIVAIGGGTKNAHWLQTKADVMGMPIEVPEVQESTALGAALLAGIGAGVYRDAEDAISKTYRTGKVVQPRLEWRAMYEEKFALYRQLYQALLPIHQEL